MTSLTCPSLSQGKASKLGNKSCSMLEDNNRTTELGSFNILDLLFCWCHKPNEFLTNGGINKFIYNL